MIKERQIFVIGHKNPDTDSICSAIAFADIKNRTSKEQIYVAKRAGELNAETEYVLSRFGMKAPEYIDDVGTQVKDMEIRETPGVGKDLSIKDAWSIMRKNEAVTLPITDSENNLEGIITTGDIAKSYMDENDSYILSKAKAQYKIIAKTIKGKILTGNPDGVVKKGKIVVGAAHPDRLGELLEEGDIIIMGDRPEVHECAIDLKAGCIVICVDGKVTENVMKKAKDNGCTIITTPLDTYTTSRLINQSICIEYIMKKEGLITFSTEDFTEDIKDIMAMTRHRAFPVVDKQKKYIGTVSRRNMLGMEKKQVVLVDHNEKSQAVDGIDDAEILEIVDHHRLGTLETMQPIAFRNQPVGCTATILYQIYTERGLEISSNIAGLLCAAILSDTLMFRSPTCTLLDKMAAGALALIADIDIEKFALEMFRAGSNLKGKNADEIFYQDFKKFSVENISFGIGQISSMDEVELEEVKRKLLPFIKEESERKGIPVIFYMLTNIMNATSELICYGENSERLITETFGVNKNIDSFVLPGVVSRKKQMVPPIMATIQRIMV
ncbi:MAG: putative manganese-dependent inorganic diphosphatase [Anaerovoracaceae bacterium]